MGPKITGFNKKQKHDLCSKIKRAFVILFSAAKFSATHNLGLRFSGRATLPEVNGAYRNLLRAFHPDKARNAGDLAKQVFPMAIELIMKAKKQVELS